MSTTCEGSAPWLPAPDPRTADLARLLADNPMYDAVIDEVRGREIRVGTHWLVDFASCNYLGLDLDPEIMAAICTQIRRWGTHPSWSRMLGNPRLYPQIEERLSALLGAPDALVLPTITHIHLSVIPALAVHGTVFVEAQAHRTIWDGAVHARALGATVQRFWAGTPDRLAELLRGAPDGVPRLVCLDGLNSMTGNIPDLPALARVCREHDALLYVDDAHGFGVLGERRLDETSPYGARGNSVVRHVGESYDNVVLVGGFSKAYSSLLAFVALPTELKNHLKVAAAPYLYSGPSPVASLAGVLAGLDVNEARGDALRARLYRLTRRVLGHLRGLGVVTPNVHDGPIIELPLAPGAELDTVARTLWDRGVYVTLAAYPLVPRDQVGFRIQLTAAHTDLEIDLLNAVLTDLTAMKALRRHVPLHVPAQRDPSDSAHRPHLAGAYFAVVIPVTENSSGSGPERSSAASSRTAGSVIEPPEICASPVITAVMAGAETIWLSTTMATRFRSSGAAYACRVSVVQRSWPDVVKLMVINQPAVGSFVARTSAMSSAPSLAASRAYLVGGLPSRSHATSCTSGFSVVAGSRPSSCLQVIEGTRYCTRGGSVCTSAAVSEPNGASSSSVCGSTWPPAGMPVATWYALPSLATTAARPGEERPVPAAGTWPDCCPFALVPRTARKLRWPGAARVLRVSWSAVGPTRTDSWLVPTMVTRGCAYPAATRRALSTSRARPMLSTSGVGLGDGPSGSRACRVMTRSPGCGGWARWARRRSMKATVTAVPATTTRTMLTTPSQSRTRRAGWVVGGWSRGGPCPSETMNRSLVRVRSLDGPVTTSAPASSAR